jgi:hypothetical protein
MTSGSGIKTLRRPSSSWPSGPVTGRCSSWPSGPAGSRCRWPAELDLMAGLAGLTLSERYAGWESQPFLAGSDQHVSVYRRG